VGIKLPEHEGTIVLCIETRTALQMIEIGIGIYEKNAFNAGCMKILRILG
jgi:hypothetical protein